LITDYEFDNLGRTTQALGPVHPVDGADTRTATWTVYLDDDFETLVGRGYQLVSTSAYATRS
jgi:hypothetical protein